MKRTILPLTLLLMACGGSIPPPNERLSQAEAAVRAADELGAKEIPQAALHLKYATDQIEEAKKNMSAEENERFNQAAIHLHPEKARELIRAGAERAVRRRREIPPFTLEAPYEYVSVTRPSRDRPGEVVTKTSDDIVALLGWPAPPTR